MTVMDNNDDASLFPVEEIVRYPLPGYTAPSSVSFSPDDRLISYLYSPDGSLYRKVFAFDIGKKRQELVFCPPDGGGLNESNLSAEEKLRRERARERGLGVTRYEWVAKNSYSKSAEIMLPLPSGIFFQKLYSSQPESKLPNAVSPIIGPHLSPDGSMVAYVRDQELYVFNLSNGKFKQLTFGASGNAKKLHG